ncbi:MAG: efflux RND transporter permease subunit [Planctomycetes bacterium]|nr:efflux RND transporter permease subunit [Planctomycetota bacterium]
MSRFFIDRPIFATVVSIVIVVMGLAALRGLPVAEYPNLAPPTIKVSASYPGADARVVAETVAAPIEQEVNGVEGMLYMSSTSSSDGAYSLTITFETGVDLDIASVQVQNRVAAAEPRLPEDVRRLGIKTQKQMPDFAHMIGIYATGEDEAVDDVFLSNFAQLRLRDELKRLPGIGDVQSFGAAEYSMRIWIDPAKLEVRGVTAGDVLAAIREQNVQVAAGKIGEPPTTGDTAFQYSVRVEGRLTDPEEFGNIVVRTGADGAVLRIRDLARVELGARSYGIASRLDQQPAAILAIYQLPGANLVQISDAVEAKLAELRPSFPAGVAVDVAFNAADVVRASIREILITLFIAAALVILTVLVFLQDFRATLIPAVTIPVSLIGTFAVMSMLGFSLNTLTLFGLVLAIGIVVDDAIVVVENCVRNVEESGLTPREAAARAMKEVTGPVIATTLVLLAVFVPTSFMPGLTGVMYQQFGLTISAATAFSSINALTLSPALCGVLLRKRAGKVNPLFRLFDRAIEWSTRGYTKIASGAVRKVGLTLLVFVACSVGGIAGFVSIPTGFVPLEDKGYLMVAAQLPQAASVDRTERVADQVDEIIASTPGVARNLSIRGYSLLDGAANPNVASSIVVLEPWEQRLGDELHVTGIVAQLRRRLAAIDAAQIVAFPVPSIPGVGLVSGFDMQVQDRGGVGIDALQTAAADLIQAAAAQSSLAGLYTSFRADVPQLFAEVDRDKVKQLGIPLSTVFDTLQTGLGGAYANDFVTFNRTYQVRVQAEAENRATPGDLQRLRLRDPAGRIVPIGALVDVREEFGPSTINRFNLFPAASVKGQAAAGASSGEALALMEQAAQNTLPTSMGFEWTGLSFQEKRSGGAGLVFLLAVLLVYLILAAQYESWSLPFTVILAVPLGLVGAAIGVVVRGYDVNVYTQIGLVLLIGLVSKNAILIVEFAREKRREGLSPADAAIDAARLRFRPILMTAFSFVLGTFPLLIATGAGAGSRTALGTVVFAGLTVATILGVVLTPAIYRAVQGIAERVGGRPRP